MNRCISLILMVFMSVASQLSVAAGNELNAKTKAAMRLWEYERDSFLTMLHVSEAEIEDLQSDSYISNAGAKLLLALSCTKPNESGQYFALYQYRCEDKPLFHISSYALKDPYILAFVKDVDREKALYYLVQYKDFLAEVQSSGKGIPVEVSYGEYVLELISFLEAGGVGSNN